MLEQQLIVFLGKVRHAGATTAEWLNPGTNNFAGFDSVDAVTLHPDLQKLWKHFNGITCPDGTHLEYTWLDGQFAYFSVLEALEDYQVSVPLWKQQADFENYWPQGFVPIGTPGDGSRLLVNCRASSPTYGSVYVLMHGDGVSRMATSLTRYFQTLNVGFDENAIVVTEQGEISYDFDAMREIGMRINPGCDGFDSKLPTASFSKDWIEK